MAGKEFQGMQGKLLLASDAVPQNGYVWVVMKVIVHDFVSLVTQSIGGNITPVGEAQQYLFWTL